MKKYVLYLASIITMATISFAQAKNNDPLFIKQDKYDSWLLSEYYNSVSLSNIKESSPVSIELKPYGYSLILTATFDQNQKQLPPTIELDVGDFTTELKKTDQNYLYTVTLEPMPALTLINSLKENKNIIIYTNNDQTINIPLKGINKAMDTMDIFAQNHYIPLPQPFSSKIDTYTTMSIPDFIPFDFYPVFRQQSYFHDICHGNNNDKNINKQEACKQDQILINIMEQHGFCPKENVELAQSFMQNNKISYQWTECQKK